MIDQKYSTSANPNKNTTYSNPSYHYNMPQIYPGSENYYHQYHMPIPSPENNFSQSNPSLPSEYQTHPHSNSPLPSHISYLRDQHPPVYRTEIPSNTQNNYENKAIINPEVASYQTSSYVNPNNIVSPYSTDSNPNTHQYPNTQPIENTNPSFTVPTSQFQELNLPTPEIEESKIHFFEVVNPNENEVIKNRLSAYTYKDRYEIKYPFGLIQDQTSDENWLELKLDNFIKVQDVDDRVETISNGWIDLSVMKQFGLYSSSFTQCIDCLGSIHHIAAWKKSRGDGNCYYRAVISRYLEIISGFYSNVKNLEEFLSILLELDRETSQIFLENEYRTAIQYIIASVNHLISTKQDNKLTAISLVHFWLQCSEFDLNLVRVARVLTFYSLIKSQKEYQDFGLDISSISSLILKMGEEAEEFVLMLLPLVLDIQVVQFNLFNEVNVQLFPNEQEKAVTVNIVRRKGHYDILYKKEELENDLFDLNEGTYHFYDIEIAK